MISIVKDENDRRSGNYDKKHHKLGNFFNHTSLHGWVYCYNPDKPFSHTVGWLTVVFTSILCSVVLIANSVTEFSDSFVSFHLESPASPLDNVLFPSVVLCNQNTLRRSFIYSLLDDPTLQSESFSNLQTIIETHFILGTAGNPSPEEQTVIDLIFNSSVFNAMFDVYYNQTQVNESYIANVPVTKWHALYGVPLNDTNRAKLMMNAVGEMATQWADGEMVARANFSGWGLYFENGFATDISQTCVWMSVFVQEPSNVQNLWTEVRGVPNGINNGLQLILDAETFDYSATLGVGQGFSISVLHPLDIPIMKQTGFDVETGQAVKVAVTPVLINTTEACEVRFLPKNRQCYFEYEVNLRNFPRDLSFRYAMGNCLFEATLEKIEKECNCTTNMFSQVVPECAVCEGVGAECMSGLMETIGSIRMIEDRGVTKECLAACEDQQHLFLISQSTFPNTQSFHRTNDFCVVLSKLIISCSGDRRQSLDSNQPNLCPLIDVISENNFTCQEIQSNLATNLSSTFQTSLRAEIARYARQNMLKVTVYIRDPYVETYLTEEMITPYNFVGTLGGILILFMGFSFLSAFEILYYGFLRVYARIFPGYPMHSHFETWAAHRKAPLK